MLAHRIRLRVSDFVKITHSDFVLLQYANALQLAGLYVSRYHSLISKLGFFPAHHTAAINREDGSFSVCLLTSNLCSHPSILINSIKLRSRWRLRTAVLSQKFKNLTSFFVTTHRVYKGRRINQIIPRRRGAGSPLPPLPCPATTAWLSRDRNAARGSVVDPRIRCYFFRSSVHSFCFKVLQGSFMCSVFYPGELEGCETAFFGAVYWVHALIVFFCYCWVFLFGAPCRSGDRRFHRGTKPGRATDRPERTKPLGNYLEDGWG